MLNKQHESHNRLGNLSKIRTKTEMKKKYEKLNKFLF